MASIKSWVEAMRLRTLPVSAAGVMAGGACAIHGGGFKWAPCLLCLLFALCAQIVSNFANEYYDFANGLDRRGREGFRRGVTEGDITPRAMRNATFGLLAVTCAIGCSLIIWGGWWLIAVGLAVAVFALAYSAGPWPLSHHGLGEIAVIIFFGLVPVMFTCYLSTGSWESASTSAWAGMAIGLMGANVLIVNNYRDLDDDRAVGKRTLAVRFGRPTMGALYLVNGFAALLCLEIITALTLPLPWQLGPLLYINLHWLLWRRLTETTGALLNPLLGRTALLMFLLSLWLLAAFATTPQI